MFILKPKKIKQWKTFFHHLKNLWFGLQILRKIKKNQKKNPARKISIVLTSEEWQEQQLKIQKEKFQKQKEIEERKKLREEARKRKLEEKPIKKAVLEEKK